MTHLSSFLTPIIPRSFIRVILLSGSVLIVFALIMTNNTILTGQHIPSQVMSFQAGKKLDENIYLLANDRQFMRPLTHFANVSIDAYDWHPDGDSVILSARYLDNESFNLYRLNVHGEIQRLNSNETTWDLNPCWSPDGTKIAFLSSRGGGLKLFVMDADGSNLKRLSRSQVDAGNFDWSPDSTQIAMVERDGISVINVQDKTVRRLTNPSGFEQYPRWTDGGESITFMLDQKTTYSINVMTGERQQLESDLVPHVVTDDMELIT
ncbi:MAG TPA: hypothetical protein VHL11_15960, partial [Phototrophicaceae bacterium]|nr:hypothetical protein [Phototrophicaceae bacterium]